MTTQRHPEHPELLHALMRIAALQREAVDRVALQEAAQEAAGQTDPRSALRRVTAHLQLKPPRWYRDVAAATLPALGADGDGRWIVVRGRNGQGEWVVETFDPQAHRWQEKAISPAALAGCMIASLRLAPPYVATNSPVLREVLHAMGSQRWRMAEAAVGGLLLAILGVFVSFYSMQVYDRVIPNAAMQTLLVLTLGVLTAILIEYSAKLLRSRLYERVIDHVDQTLARSVYTRFLSIRLDQMPSSVGSLAGQLRGYESVRAFLVTLTSHVAVDAPFALIFVGIIGAIAGPLLYIPLGFLIVCVVLGLARARRIAALAQRNQQLANLKTGLLVESVEAAETIKSGQGGWRMLNRWLLSTDEARSSELELRHINEGGQYLAMALQQVAYVSMVAAGAWMASQGLLSFGGLIACSILSGRILTPVTQLSMLLSSWANTQASLRNLDALWKLEGDHHGQPEPVVLERLRGDYRLAGVDFALAGKRALAVGSLSIAAGERIGVVGPVGSGKSTLLRLLSGMYKPGQGRIHLDDVDIAHLSKPLLAEHVGYLQQEGRLLSGTLRENLVLGLLDPGDEAILAAARQTGLYRSVIATHPSGLQQVIAEGGTGLSNGQRQPVSYTHLTLPTIYSV